MFQNIQSEAQTWVLALTSVFFLVDPFAVIPTFLAMTAQFDAPRRKAIARRAAITCFLVLTCFALAGRLIFRVFGITLPAFQIAGGLILLLVGLEMLRAQRSSTQESPKETEEAMQKEDPSVIPLGIPMLAGPGAISTVMVMIGPSVDLGRDIPIFAAIAITSFLSLIILSAADRVRKILGEIGINIFTRIMGLILTAIAMQFFINGLAGLGLIHLPKP